jgi:hypothetical protein
MLGTAVFESEETSFKGVSMKRSATGAAFAVLVAAITSCAVPKSPGVPPTASPDAVVFYERQGDSSEQALLAGQLALVNGCVVVQEPTGRSTIPVFPKSGFKWDGTKLRYGNASYSLEDKVSFGGGFGAEAATVVGRDSVVVPVGCNRDDVVFFVQP